MPVAQTDTVSPAYDAGTGNITDTSAGANALGAFDFADTVAGYAVGVGVSAATPTVTGVSATPSTATVQGGATQQFSATVTGTNSPGQGVTWSATLGAITSGGLYTAPTATSSIQSATITATSTVNTSKSATATVTIPAGALPVAGTPTFSPAAGTYTSAQSVTLSSATSGAAIYYTLDGSVPTTSSTLYSSAIAVGTPETVKAITHESGYSDSAVASAAYMINLPSGGTSPTTLLIAAPIDATYPSGLTALQQIEEIYVIDQCKCVVEATNTTAHTQSLTYYAADGTTVLATATLTLDSATNQVKQSRARLAFNWNNFATAFNASGNLLLTTPLDSTVSGHSATIGSVLLREDAIRTGQSARTVTTTGSGSGQVTTDAATFYGQGGTGAGAVFVSTIATAADGGATRTVTAPTAN